MALPQKPWPKVPLWLPIAGLIPTIYAFTLPPAKGFMTPNLARILFFHLPGAFMVTGMPFLLLYFGLRALSSKEVKTKLGWDARNGAITELMLLFSALTLVSGILFSKAQWGDWWSNDPRQTSFLMVSLILIGAVTLRSALKDPERRASASAGFSAFSSLPLFFLIYIYPNLPQVKSVSLHPTGTVRGGLTGPYWIGVLSMFAILLWLTVILYRRRLWLDGRSIERAYETGYSDTDRVPVTGVVQPRAVHPVDGADEAGL